MRRGDGADHGRRAGACRALPLARGERTQGAGDDRDETARASDEERRRRAPAKRPEPRHEGLDARRRLYPMPDRAKNGRKGAYRKMPKAGHCRTGMPSAKVSTSAEQFPSPLRFDRLSRPALPRRTALLTIMAEYDSRASRLGFRTFRHRERAQTTFCGPASRPSKWWCRVQPPRMRAPVRFGKTPSRPKLVLDNDLRQAAWLAALPRSHQGEGHGQETEEDRGPRRPPARQS